MAIKNPIHLFLPLQIHLKIILTLKERYFQFDNIQITMSPNTTEISPLIKLAPSSNPKIPSVSRLPKTFPMAYGLVLKITITITNINNILLKILIISPTFWPYCLFAFSSTPSFLTSWLLVPTSIACFSTLSSPSHTFPIAKSILSIICVMPRIWNLSSPSGWGGVLF